MFADELKNFHLKIGKEEEQWINENVEKLDENQKLNFSRELQNYKEITILALKKVYQEITGKKAKEHIWAVCLECGCEYDYDLPCCPACYDKGFDCRAKAVKKSEFQPPMKVIRFNKHYMNGDKGEQICYTCIHKKESYCRNFGNPNWNCKREEFEMCECKTCCGIAKRANAELEKSRSREKFSYAVPLKR